MQTQGRVQACQPAKNCLLPAKPASHPFDISAVPWGFGTSVAMFGIGMGGQKLSEKNWLTLAEGFQ